MQTLVEIVAEIARKEWAGISDHNRTLVERSEAVAGQRLPILRYLATLGNLVDAEPKTR